jgi:hypothetical protein
MDTQTLLNLLFGAIGALLSWILKSVTDSVKDLQKADTDLANKVQEIELLVVGDYIKHSDFKEFSAAIFAKLDRMEGKIDGKQDKSK